MSKIEVRTSTRRVEDRAVRSAYTTIDTVEVVIGGIIFKTDAPDFVEALRIAANTSHTLGLAALAEGASTNDDGSVPEYEVGDLVMCTANASPRAPCTVKRIHGAYLLVEFDNNVRHWYQPRDLRKVTP